MRARIIIPASRNEFEKSVIFDKKGNLRVDRANGLLRAHLAKENGLEDTDEAFKNWGRVNKTLEQELV